MEPRLIAAVGSRRDRFESANSLACFAGIAPVKQSSGGACWIHWRRACPKFIRQTFHEWAACSIRCCDWARVYYEQQRAKGKGHHAAVRALAYKWIRVFFRCWRDRVPYSEERYLKNLRPAQTSAGQSASQLKFEWKPCAGFSKLVEVLEVSS